MVRSRLKIELGSGYNWLGSEFVEGLLVASF